MGKIKSIKITLYINKKGNIPIRKEKINDYYN